MQKMVVVVQEDLWYDLGDEELIIVVDLQGEISFHSSSICTHASHEYEKRRSELFHIRFIAMNTNIETLFDPGSQVNLNDHN